MTFLNDNVDVIHTYQIGIVSKNVLSSVVESKDEVSKIKTSVRKYQCLFKHVWCPDRAICETNTARTSKLYSTLIRADTQIYIKQRKFKQMYSTLVRTDRQMCIHNM